MEKEEDDNSRTIDCLRGRLLAERVASRTTKEEAYKLAKRLQELERKLAEEIKCRDRAQKKLKYAMKKLESLTAFDGLRDESDMPLSSVGSSSSQCCLWRQTFEGEISPVESAHRLVFIEKSWSSAKKLKSHCEEVRQTEEKDQGFSPEEREVCHLRRESSAQDCESGDSMLALVSIGKSLSPGADNPEVKNNVERVLLSLRKVKELLIQSSSLTAEVYPSKMHFR